MGILCSSCAPGESDIEISKKKKVKRKVQGSGDAIVKDSKNSPQQDKSLKLTRKSGDTQYKIQNSWRNDSSSSEEGDSKLTIMQQRKKASILRKSKTRIKPGTSSLKLGKKSLYDAYNTVKKTSTRPKSAPGTRLQGKLSQNRTQTCLTISETNKDIKDVRKSSKPKSKSKKEARNKPGKPKRKTKSNDRIQKAKSTPEQRLILRGDLSSPDEVQPDIMDGESYLHEEKLHLSPNKSLTYEDCPTEHFEDYHVDYYDETSRKTPSEHRNVNFHTFRPPGTDIEVLVGLRQGGDGDIAKGHQVNGHPGSPYAQLKHLSHKNNSSSGYTLDRHTETPQHELKIHSSHQENHPEYGSQNHRYTSYMTIKNEQHMNQQDDEYSIILPLKKCVDLHSGALTAAGEMSDMCGKQNQRTSNCNPTPKQVPKKPDIQEKKRMLEAENLALQKMQSLQDFGVDVKDLKSLHAPHPAENSPTPREPFEGQGWAARNDKEEPKNRSPKHAAALCMEELKTKFAGLQNEAEPGGGQARLNYRSEYKQLPVLKKFIPDYGGKIINKKKNSPSAVKKWPTVVSPPQKRRAPQKGFPRCPPEGVSVMSYHISQSEFSTLKDPGNPGEKVILAYLRLQAQNTTTFVLEREVIDSWRDSLDLLPNVQLISYEKLIGPFDPIKMRFGAPGNWILFYANVKNGTMSILDSRSESHEHRHQDQFGYFKTFWEKRMEKRINWKEEIIRCGQQQDNISDGMFCMLHGLCLIRGQKPSSVKQKNIEKFRLHIAQKLLRYSKKPDNMVIF